MPITQGQGPVLNNVKWALSGSIADTDTIIEIPFGTPGYSDMFSMLTAGYYFLLTFVREDEEIDHEIVKVVDGSFEPFVEIERGWEDTTPENWIPGDRVEMRLTRDTMRRHKEIGDRYLFTADGRILFGLNGEILLDQEPDPLPTLY